LIGSLAGCLEDKRQAGKVDHPLRELLAQNSTFSSGVISRSRWSRS
jgi:hypothetical protein